MWNRFVKAVEKLQLTVKQQEKKLEDVYVWIKKNVSPSLYLLFKLAKGELQILLDLIKAGRKEITNMHQLMPSTQLICFEKEYIDNSLL